MGWEMGLEPTTPRATTWCSDQLSYTHHIFLSLLARLAGFEPAARGLEGRCSIQLSYRRLIPGAGDGNRTHVTSLEGWGSTIELHPRAKDIIPQKLLQVKNSFCHCRAKSLIFSPFGAIFIIIDPYRRARPTLASYSGRNFCTAYFNKTYLMRRAVTHPGSRLLHLTVVSKRLYRPATAGLEPARGSGRPGPGG
ncbi:Uncharacterized [Moorella glycerini]|nr:Uncharacterized [Moorella glycerini]